MESHRRRIGGVLMGALLVSSAGLAMGTTGISAAYSARARNAVNAFATTALYAPGALSGTATGLNVALSWTEGRNGTGYTIRSAPNGASSDCSTAVLQPKASVVTTSYVDTSVGGAQGSWSCYQAQTSAGAWTSVQGNPIVAVQVGFVATTVTTANGGASGKLDTGDSLVVQFNQPVATASGPDSTNTVCGTTDGSIVLGAVATNGSCSPSEAATVGVLAGGAMSHNTRWAATYGWSTDARSLTITLGGKVAGPNALFTVGSWTFTPTSAAGRLLAATGGAHVCTSAGPNEQCRPTTTSSF